MFTEDRILRLCPHAAEIDVDEVAAALELYHLSAELTTPLRVAHFMGQIAYESDGMNYFVENLDYSAGRVRTVWPRLSKRSEHLAHNPEALANAAYALELGNGDEGSGDGWLFRGRGLIQITGRANYAHFGAMAGLDLLRDPDQAMNPTNAIRIALAFWRSRNCNVRADADDVEAVTRAINGPGLLGLPERAALTKKAKAIFTIDDPLIA